MKRNYFRDFIDAFKSDITVIGGPSLIEKQKKREKRVREWKEFGIGMAGMVAGMFFLAVGQYTYDRFQMVESQEYFVKNDKRYSDAILECFDANVGVVAVKEEGDVRILAEELVELCKMEVNSYRGLLAEYMGATGHYGWGHMYNAIMRDASDTILLIRRTPKMEIKD